MKRRSTTSKPPEPTFFLDRNLGKHKLSKLLRDAGFRIEVHDDHFGQTEDDAVWLLWCGTEGFAVITPDARLKTEVKSMEAILAGGTKVFLLSKGSITSEKWAAALTQCRAELVRMVKTPGPFISHITVEGRIWGMERVTRAKVDEVAVKAYQRTGRE